MKPSVFALFLIVLVSCNKNSDPIAVPSELLINGNMDAGTGSPWWNSWKSAEVSNYVLTWSTTQFTTSYHSLKISCANSDPTNFSFWAQTYRGAMPVGKDLILKVKIKHSMTGDGVSIAIRGDDTTSPSGNAEQFVTSQTTSPISGNADWTIYQVKMYNVQSNLKSITVYFIYLQNTTGEVYFDEAGLTQVE